MTRAFSRSVVAKILKFEETIWTDGDIRKTPPPSPTPSLLHRNPTGSTAGVQYWIDLGHLKFTFVITTIMFLFRIWRTFYLVARRSCGTWRWGTQTTPDLAGVSSSRCVPSPSSAGRSGNCTGQWRLQQAYTDSLVWCSLLRGHWI